MRVFKPLQLSLLHKTYSWQHKHHLAVTLMLGFPFDRSQEVLLEQDLWQFIQQYVPGGILDACMPKPQGEVVVYGAYHAPGGKPVSAGLVELSMGPVHKKLLVMGDRYWRALLPPTEPEAFTEMPISYEYAFGGKGFKPNPLGKGIERIEMDGEERVPLPNIENPEWPMTAQNAHPDPNGFAPLDMTWQFRQRKMGTYDEDWLQNHFPGFPADLDWTHFNTAPQDQWIAEFWQGNESFRIINMHPTKPVVKGELPGFRMRCWVEQQSDSGPDFKELEMHGETVSLFPGAETGVAIYRGVIEVAQDDAADIEHLLVAYEDLAEAPRSRDYYHDALRNRLDEKKVFKYLMSTRDIIPESERCGFVRMLDGVEVNADSAFAANMEAKGETIKQQALELLEQQKQTLEQSLKAAGIDPAPYLEKIASASAIQADDDPHMQAILKAIETILPGSTGGDPKKIKIQDVDFSGFDEFNQSMERMAEARKQEAQQLLQDAVKQVEGSEVEQQAREQVDRALQQMNEPPDLPRSQAEPILISLRDQLQQIEQSRAYLREQGVAEGQLPRPDIDLAEVENKIREGFAQLKAVYRRSAHHVEGKPPHAEPMDIVQYRMQKRLDKGESLAGLDLAGVDFSGLDLSGKDLSECYLEYCNFSRCNLQHANLAKAVITHANLSFANLTDADLSGANLGDSLCQEADFTRARLTDAEFGKANLKQARLIDCNLHNVMFLEAEMNQVNLSGSSLAGANFLKLNFSDGLFVGSEMRECNFLQCNLGNTDFSNANLSGSSFIECNLDHSCFKHGNLYNARFPMGCSLLQCNFEHANLDQVNLRDANAAQSSFEFATFHQADFSGANLQRTKFYGAAGKRAMLIKTDLGGADFSSVNLMEGSLMKARLTNTDLRDSNLYAVEFLNATVGDTDFEGANLDMTKLEQWRPQREA